MLKVQSKSDTDTDTDTDLSLLLRMLLTMLASWGAAAMLRRTDTRRMASTRGEVSREGDTVRSLSEISASWSWYLR